MTEGQRLSLEAVRAFTREVTVLVNPGHRKDNIASGVLICNESGKPFIVTAAHPFKDAPAWNPTKVGIPALGEEISDAVSDVVYAPEVRGREVDVAVLVLSADAQQRLAGLGAHVDQLATDSMLDSDAYGFLTGFPIELMKVIDREGSTITIGIAAVHYETESNGLDDLGRIRVKWHPEPLQVQQLSNDLKRSKTGELKIESPVGISGAAFWKYPLPAAGEIWAPRKNGKLVGIAVAWNRIRYRIRRKCRRLRYVGSGDA